MSARSKAVFEEIYNGPTPVVVASFVPKLFTYLLENALLISSVLLSHFFKR